MSFYMEQSDIYSLFGNAIDNATEAVDKLIDEEHPYDHGKISRISVGRLERWYH